MVRRVGLLAQKNAPLRLRFTEGALDVSAQTPDVGEASESPAGAVRGRAARDRLQPGVLPRRPRERGVGGAVLKLISPLRPGLIQSGDEGGGFIYLVMPIRLNV